MHTHSLFPEEPPGRIQHGPLHYFFFDFRKYIFMDIQAYTFLDVNGFILLCNDSTLNILLDLVVFVLDSFYNSDF